ncbi:MAG: glutaminyl-peptide cyclotransferase, partial [Vicinamibacterales bacterium]
MKRTALTLGVVLMTAGLAASFQRAGSLAPAQGGARLPVYGYEVVRTYPHDRGAFTQGLVFHDGLLYEGTGLQGRSSIRRVRLETGEVLNRRGVPAQYFGEGIALANGELFQLTWKSGVAFVYDLESLGMTRSFNYRGEGWGLTYDGTSLIMSDGTDQIRFLDPRTFSERRRIRVTGAGRPVHALYELELIEGEIWANVWQTDQFARIDPASGNGTAWVDLCGLLSPAERA